MKEHGILLLFLGICVTKNTTPIKKSAKMFYVLEKYRNFAPKWISFHIEILFLTLYL